MTKITDSNTMCAMEQDTLRQLESLGLREHEAALYMAIAREPLVSVTHLSRRVGAKRTSIYEYLDKLLVRGIIRRVVVGKRIRYEAEPSRVFVELAKSAERVARENVLRAERLADALKDAVQSRGPKVSVYEGKRGVEDAYRQVADTWQDLYSVFSPRNFFRHFTYTENDQLLDLLREREICVYDLLERSQETERHITDHKDDSAIKAKLLPAGVRFSTDIIVSAERLALISFGSLTATVIEDIMLAQAQRQTLKVLWDKL